MSDLPARISLREVGPRDGLQNEDPVPASAKIALIDQLATTGVRRIEAVSFVKAEAIPQMADADEVWAGVTKDPAVRYSALAPNLRGARRALDAGFTEVEAVVSASDTHNRKNVNRGTAAVPGRDRGHDRRSPPAGRHPSGGRRHRLGLPI